MSRFWHFAFFFVFYASIDQSLRFHFSYFNLLLFNLCVCTRNFSLTFFFTLLLLSIFFSSFFRFELKSTHDASQLFFRFSFSFFFFLVFTLLDKNNN